MKNTILASLTSVVLVISFSQSAQAGLLANYRDDFQGPTPAPGWSYLWNSAGAIGNPMNYTPLLWNSSVYGETGSVVPGPDPGYYIYLGPGNGHPGRGVNRGNAGGVDRYAIAAYTLSTGGLTSITDSQLQTNNPTGLSNGVELEVFVNSTLVPGSDIFLAPLSSTTFNLSLGSLSPGDTIYVAIGPHGNDESDGFNLDFTLQQQQATAVPEPSTLALFGFGAIGLLGYGWRRKRELAG